MKTIEIELALMRHYKYLQNIIVPNVTPASGLVGFESDILMLTKSGYATCFEIKISKADLLNDLKKPHIKKLNEFVSRHIQMIGFDWYYKTLKHFVYAVPVELKDIALSQIPDFAGLVVAGRFPDSCCPDRVFIREVKAPKLINKHKWTDKQRYDLLRIGTMRIYNLKQNTL